MTTSNFPNMCDGAPGLPPLAYDTWKQWLLVVELKARAAHIWQYVDILKPEDELTKIIKPTRPTMPGMTNKSNPDWKMAMRQYEALKRRYMWEFELLERRVPAILFLTLEIVDSIPQDAEFFHETWEFESTHKLLLDLELRFDLSSRQSGSEREDSETQ
ncbi:hypothetical protein BU16DRAFT_567962 [Lophium mytilinum]|uniref:Uncharacterized protein n=1 Tax=Lophium mytilinum TaxID=390894 RepID=A0A6A6Q9V5_9PEZI|nr:hypothetical protein BU16DRAFT_567962 [Lophium mytilinum]